MILIILTPFLSSSLMSKLDLNVIQRVILEGTQEIKCIIVFLASILLSFISIILSIEIFKRKEM